MQVGVITYRLMLVIETMIGYAQKLLSKQAIAKTSEDYSWLFHAASYPIRYISKLTIAFYKNIERKNRSLSRYMEFEADTVACKIVGTDVHISALCKIQSLSKRYNTFRLYLLRLNVEGRLLKDYLPGYGFTNELLSADENLPISYVNMVSSPIDNDSFSNSRIVIYDGWNTHPTLKERIDNAKVQNCYSSKSDAKDACLLIPEIITNKIGVISQSSNRSELKDISLDDFKEWMRNMIENHRNPHDITPFLEKNIDSFSLPNDDEFDIDSIVSPFTEDNKLFLLEFSQAQTDIQTLYDIQLNDSNTHFSYMGNMNMSINDAISNQKKYLDYLETKIANLDVEIYKYLWKHTYDKNGLKEMYLLLFYCKETMNSLKSLRDKTETIYSHLLFFQMNGASVRLKDETLDELMMELEQFITHFDTELLAKLSGEHNLDKVFNVKQTIHKWQDFLSSTHEGIEILMFIQEIWTLLSNLHYAVNKEREKRILCAYKGNFYNDVND